MNNLENKYILSEELIDAIDRILEKVPHVVFGGSIALNAVGLISRKINDIDIFLPMNENFKEFISIGALDEMTSDTVTDMNGKEIQRVGAKINDVKVCCFKVGAVMSCVIVITSVSVHPFAAVTVTVYVPGAVIESAAEVPTTVEPLLHE